MPRRIGIAVLLLAVGVVIGVALRPNVAADPPKEEKKEKPIPIDEVRKRGVLGDLGYPLGTIVTIEGEVEEFDGLKHGKALESKTLLRVKSVNGVGLKDGVLFGLDFAEADKPKVGAKFKYTGYEGGRFDGIVPGSSKYTGPRQGVRYGFHNYFHIYKDELNLEKK